MRWADGWWTSPDGLRLHLRDYPGDPLAIPLLCLPGLTRNARDFEDLAPRLSGGRRVLAAELRGRGESACPKDPMTYLPPAYLGDILALFEQFGIGRIAIVGTSLGGLLAMMLAAARPGLVAGALLNDVGPVIEPGGLERIRGYVGRQTSWPTWLHAARALAEVHGVAYPLWALQDWLRFAKRLCRVNAAGRIVGDYDVRIAEPFKLPPPAEPVDLWPALDALAPSPVLIVRGARSDILSPATAAAMRDRLPDAELVEVPDVGHAPTLDEPDALAAIGRWLERVSRTSS